MKMYSWNGVGYDPETGEMWWIVRKPRVKVGAVITRTGGHGYRQVKINGKTYLQHRLAWKMVFGYWPKEQIDHKNGDKQDNRIENLREVSNSTNLRNQDMRKSRSNTGVRGVHYRKSRDRYEVRIGDGSMDKPGCKYKTVKTLAEAVRLRRQWEKEQRYGREFANG